MQLTVAGGPVTLLKDQFLTSRDRRGRRRPRFEQVLYLVPSVGVSLLLWRQEANMMNAGTLLTATSILTGLTFSMTVTFWGKSIDARRDARFATDAHVLTALDDNRTHLLWTVLVGLVATALFAMISLFADPARGAPVGWTALSGALLIYLVTLVVIALHRFARAAFVLR